MLKVTRPDLNDTQIAETIGVSKVTVCKWKKNEEFQEALDKELKKQWKDAVTRAQKKLIELTESPRDDVALNAVKYILSSNGYDAPQKIEADVNEKVIKVDIVDDD